MSAAGFAFGSIRAAVAAHGDRWQRERDAMIAPEIRDEVAMMTSESFRRGGAKPAERARWFERRACLDLGEWQ